VELAYGNQQNPVKKERRPPVKQEAPYSTKMLIPILMTGSFFQTFVLMDMALKRYRFQNPYYAIHALHNAMIVALTAPDLWITMTDFKHLELYEPNWTSAYLCFALHFYHIWVYYPTFRFDDWLHHILMVGVALPLGLSVPSSTLLGFSLFFTTGLPGGIDYALLFGVRNGWLQRLTEKRINKELNVWIRSPGCIAHATLSLLFLSAHMASGTASAFLIPTLITAALVGWNGQYFMQQVVTDYATVSSREANHELNHVL
jgi:hypothetical protein